MAGRIRTIKPELLEDERTACLSDRAYRLFIGALLIADDYGNLRADARYLAGAITWGIEGTAAAAETAVRELAVARLLSVYDLRGQRYAAVRGWDKHQKVDKPGRPRVPGPADIEAKSIQLVAEDSRDPRETLARLQENHATDLRPPTSDLRPPTCTSDPEGDLSLPRTVAVAPEFDFAAVYQAYPKRIGKTKGMARLRTSVKTAADWEQLNIALKHYQAFVAGKDQQYTKQFDTWATTWRDWVEVPQENARASNGPLTAQDIWNMAQAAEAAERKAGAA